MENQILNIDSRLRNKTQYPNSAYYNVPLNPPLKNVKYMKISSIEIPNMFYTFTQKRDNISFNFNFYDPANDVIVGDPVTVTIEEGMYDSNTIIDHIQLLFDSININLQCVFAILSSGISAKCSITCDRKFTINFSNTGSYESLGAMLGFRQKIYTSIETIDTEGNPLFVITGDEVMNINGDTYIYLNINDYGKISLGNTFVNAVAKIVLSQNKANMIFDNTASYVSKDIIFRQPITIANLNMRLFDYLNNTLETNGDEHSMTIEFGCEYVNDMQSYNAITNNNLGRHVNLRTNQNYTQQINYGKIN